MSDENKNTNNDSLLEDDLEISENTPPSSGSGQAPLESGQIPLESGQVPVESEQAEEDTDTSDGEAESIEESDIFDDKDKEDNSEHELSDLSTEDSSVDSANLAQGSLELKKDEDAVTISKSKIALANAILKNIKESNEKLINIFSGFSDDSDIAKISLGQIGEIDNQTSNEEEGGSIIEGVFDGENMIGPDGKQYSVPANYASKSKLVEGDILKLTITGRGTFVYKQIGPIERIRIIGELEKNSDDLFVVNSEGKRWKILPASVTYFKGKIGDEVVLLVPKAGESKWAAVENIIRNKKEDGVMGNSF